MINFKNPYNYIKRLALYVLLFFLVPGCISTKKSTLPLGSKLDFKTLTKAEQIYFSGAYLILLYDMSKNAEYRSTFLLFYDKHLKMKGAAYFSSEGIESIDGNVIKGYLNKYRKNRIHQYTNILPEKYSLQLIERQGGSGRESNKVIEDIQFDYLNKNVKLCVKTSSDKYIGLRSGEINFNSFNNTDTLELPLSKIQFDYNAKTLFITKINSNNYLIRDIMIFKNDSILVKFYEKLWKRLAKS
ncbi:hypothetical protein [uncultured Microscilla sp.]|uniref:hypothetical protein n=1 Tax=uncultured Microscilla sp. TaxID=432653 RepID=UPI00262DE02C|nr:hypothetical protein [uncultured Microscilla sp.]